MTKTTTVASSTTDVWLGLGCNFRLPNMNSLYDRLVPIMLLKLPIMLWSNAPIAMLQYSSYYAQIMLHKLTLSSKKQSDFYTPYPFSLL